MNIVGIDLPNVTLDGVDMSTILFNNGPVSYSVGYVDSYNQLYIPNRVRGIISTIIPLIQVLMMVFLP